MFAELVQSDVRNERANGRRYSAIDRETAYLCWKTTAGRSHRKVAELLAISPSTIGSWSQADTWVKRAQREDIEDAESLRVSIGAMFASQVVASLATVVEIRDSKDSPPRDRLAAAVWILGVAGMAPITKSQQAVTFSQTQPLTEDQELDGLSVEELMAIEAKSKIKQ